MSLFGNLGGGGGNQPASSASFKPLFGSAPAASSAPASGGLFAGLGASSSAPSGTSQPASSGGLGGSLFGGNASTAATTSAPGLSFGGTSTSQSQPSGLFSNPSSQAPQQSTTANPQQTGTLGGSFFSASSAPQQQQQQQSQQQPTLQSNGVGGLSSHFDHLLERGRKRNAGDNGLANFEELPSLQLGLGDIARKVRNLGAGGPSADQAQERAAHYLLSASGVKLGSTLRDLNQFSTQSGVSTTGPAANVLDTDVDGYLSNLHSQSTLALIQEGLEQSKRDFDSFLEENVQIEWDAQRKRIYEHFGLGRQSEEMAASQSAGGFGASTARGAFGRSTRKGRSMGPKAASTNGASFGASGAAPVLGSVMSPYQKRALNGQDSAEKSAMGGQSGPEDRFVRDKQEKFTEKVKELNVTRLQQAPYPVLHAFGEVEQQSGSDYAERFAETYNALISLTGEVQDPHAAAGSNIPRARCFVRDYHDLNVTAPNSIRLRKRIINGSRTHLEKQFLQSVQKTISKHPGEANAGGVPTNLAKIRGYIRVKIAHKELTSDIEQLQKIGTDGDEFPWVIIFFLLRSGLTQEASEYVRERRNFFQNNDRNFAAAIAQYVQDPERRLSPDMQQKINHVFAQRARIAPTNDPYRMACYKIIGRCEMTRRTLDALPPTMEDWVWLQFNLAREGNPAEENAGEIFGLQELRASVTDIGQRHFATNAEAAGGYGLYFYLATLAGMFEQAINYLYEHNYVSAVHFAIALDYYGLLRVSDWASSGTQILTYTARQQPQLNFGRVVGTYTGDFRSAKADAAAEYLILICLNADLPGEAGKQQASLCHEALRELVLETREFSTLLGDLRLNGNKVEGLIQERLPLINLADQAALIKNITQEAAKTADDNGRTNDAVLLCHLAEEYDAVVQLLNRALAEALSVELGQEPLRLEPLRQRAIDARSQADAQAAATDTNSSLSLLGTDDPVDLALRVMTLYDNDPRIIAKVDQRVRDTLLVLYRLNQAKKLIEAGQYMNGLDAILHQHILPLEADGNLSMIRSSANTFSSLPTELTRNVGNLLLWCIMCCSRHREVLRKGQFESVARGQLADQLLQKAKDLMVFAGLIKYKLPPRVFETLAREGQEVGAF